VPPASLTVDGVAADLPYAASAPGYVGLMQIDFTVPSSAAIGDAVAVQIAIGSVQSPAVTIAVKQKRMLIVWLNRACAARLRPAPPGRGMMDMVWVIFGRKPDSPVVEKPKVEQNLRSLRGGLTAPKAAALPERLGQLRFLFSITRCSRIVYDLER
jgi:hypothetical protein